MLFRGERTSTKECGGAGNSESRASLKSATVMLNFNLTRICLVKDLSGQMSITKKLFFSLVRLLVDSRFNQ